VLKSFDLCGAAFFTFSNLKKVGGDDDIYSCLFFLKNKIKIVAVFSHHYVKLIILKGLMSLLTHYVSQLFCFDN